MEKYIVDGKVAILYSPGYGSGWSTWNTDNSDIKWDKRVVEFFMRHKDDIGYLKHIRNECGQEHFDTKAFLAASGYEGIYLGGFHQIKIAWLPVGTKFVIKEYDGSEYIETEDDFDWDVA